MTNIFLHFSTTAGPPKCGSLYALSNRNACNTREAEFSRKSVKDDYPDFPLTCFSPVPKTSLMLSLHLVFFFLTRHEFASMDKEGTQRKSINMSRKSVFDYKVYKRPLFSPDVNFAFNGQEKMELKRKSMNDKNHKTCAKNHRNRCLMHYKH